MVKKTEWRKRTSGTSRQIGQAFPLMPSMQKLRTALPSAAPSLKKRILDRQFRREEEEKQKRHDKATFETEWEDQEEEEGSENDVPVNVDALRVLLEHKSDEMDMTKKDVNDMTRLFEQSNFPKTERGIRHFLEEFQRAEDDVSQ